MYDIALKHLEKYEPYLTNVIKIDGNKEKIIRTTNALEQKWGSAKRTKRQVTGKKKLTREFNSLPKEYFLVQNLKNPDYVNLVLGNIKNLPEKLAEANNRSESYSSWLKKQNSNNMSQISKTLLRNDSFIEDIIAESPIYLGAN